MTEYCAICGTYEKQDNFKDLSCGCRFCKVSVGHWVTAQLDNYHKDNFFVTCPQGMLGHNLNDDDLKMCLTQEQIEQYEIVRLKKNLMKSSEYKICPMSHCNYIGWVDKGKSCSESLVCGKCNALWIDPSLSPGYIRLYGQVVGFFVGTSDFWNFIWKEIWVKYCPKCDSPIEKNGGCLHMTCTNCTYEFCWICLQPYRNHSNSLCQISIGYVWGMIVMIMIGTFVRLYVISDVFAGILSYFMHKVLLVFVGGFTCVLVLGTITMFLEYRKNYYFDFLRKIFLVFAIICNFAALYAIIYFYWFYLEIIGLAVLLGLTFGVNFGSCYLIYNRS
ncbi:hypothetical protein SteCoe_24204 [Stentor coeruleus]|uniref:RING-type domain-containing protein n=1 Tax=Stentor coeruleus TaxID=5963 RepID=A0A1R2BI28_9CILI|nr:hypothetical protein SteCoe_24204 [Stentor coeruleus]